MLSLFSHPRYRPIIGAVLMALAGALAVAVIWAVFATRTTQLDRAKSGDVTLRAAVAAEKGTNLLVDCLTVGGKCFERQQAQTADVLGVLRRYIVLASACADKPGEQTADEIESCVERRLARDAG